LIRRPLWGHIAHVAGGGAMEGKAKYIFPVLITAIIVFVVSGVVTWTNIGFRADFVPRWLSAFIVGWPVAAVTAYVAIPVVRRATQRLAALIDGTA
jgi:cytochrome b subunit of formate dehydrogenase